MNLLYSLQAKDVTVLSDCMEAVSEIKASDFNLLANGGLVQKRWHDHDIQVIQRVSSKLVHVQIMYTSRSGYGIYSS